MVLVLRLTGQTAGFRFEYAKTSPSIGIAMERLYNREGRPTTFGDLAVVGFVLVQCLDGVFTYLGVKTWGPGIEANPLISSAMTFAGLGLGLAGTKLIAVSFGIVLHLRRIHLVVAILTAFYLAAAIVPWTTLFLHN